MPILERDPVEPRKLKPLGPDVFEDFKIPEPARRAVGTAIFGGDDPKAMRTEDLLALVKVSSNGDNVEGRYRDRIRSPLTAIRSYCVECSGGSPKQAGECVQVSCPLWMFRFGTNPLFGQKETLSPDPT